MAYQPSSWPSAPSTVNLASSSPASAAGQRLDRTAHIGRRLERRPRAPETSRASGTGAPITTRAGSPSRGSQRTCSAASSAASTTRRGGAAGSAASSRSDARAASVSAAYSSSSSSPLAYASRSAGVTANPGSGPGPTCAGLQGPGQSGQRRRQEHAHGAPESATVSAESSRQLSESVGRPSRRRRQCAVTTVAIASSSGTCSQSRTTVQPARISAASFDPVTLDVLDQLRAPVPLVRLRLGAVFRAGVPEAAVDEDRHLARGERDIRPHAPAAVQVEPVILAVAVAEPVQGAAAAPARAWCPSAGWPACWPTGPRWTDADSPARAKARPEARRATASSCAGCSSERHAEKILQRRGCRLGTGVHARPVMPHATAASTFASTSSMKTHSRGSRPSACAACRKIPPLACACRPRRRCTTASNSAGKSARGYPRIPTSWTAARC